MSKRVAREIWEYDSMADFEADGGAAAYGDGQVIINGESFNFSNGVVGSINKPIGVIAARSTCLVFGNSLAGQNSVLNATAMTTTTTAVPQRAGVYSLPLVAGGVAVAGFSVGDYLVVNMGNQQNWVVKITAIAGDIVSFDTPLPAPLRLTANVGKVGLPALWPLVGAPRGQYGHFNWANALLGGPLHMLHGYGFGGGKIIDIAASLQDCLKRFAPNYVYICGPENDIAGGITLLQLKTVYLSMYDTCVSLGVKPVFESCFPSDSINSVPLSAVFDQFNAFLISTLKPLGAIVINSTDFYLDKTVTTQRRPTAGYTDGIHPNNDKRLTIGKVTSSLLLPYIPKLSKTPGILGPNTLLEGTAGTLTGTHTGLAPDNTTINSTSALVSSVLSRVSDNTFHAEVSIANDSNIGTTQWQITQTITIPINVSKNAYGKGVIRFNNITARNISIMQLNLTIGACNLSTGGVTDQLNTEFLVNQGTLLIETPAIPFRDVTATTMTLQFAMRPETIAGVADVQLSADIAEFGFVLSVDEQWID